MTFAFYLSRIFVFSITGVILTLGALAGLLDILENGNTVIARNGRAIDLLHYAALIAPTIMASVIPIASLTGALIAFSNLAGRNEIVAIRTSGVTLYWIVARLAPAAITIGALYFILRFVIAPYTEIHAHEWLTEPEAAVAAVDAVSNASYWISSGPTIIGFESASKEGAQLRGVIILERDASGRLSRHTAAKQARHTPAGWVFENVVSQFVARAGAAQAQSGPFRLVNGPLPIDIQAAMIPNARVRFRQPGLPEAQVWAGGASPAFHQTNFFDAMAAPFVPFLMLLATAPLALGTSRYPSRARDISIALCIGFGYLLTGGISRSLGESGVLPPLLAIGGPLIIFLLAAISILAHREG